MAKFYRIKNKTARPLILTDGQGDEVQIQPHATSTIDAKFIDFQLPPLQHAEVIGYDYNSLLANVAQQPQSSDAQ